MSTPANQQSPAASLHPSEHTSSSPAAVEAVQAATRHSEWAALRRLLPYLWQYKLRVVAALAFMVSSRLANIGLIILFKILVDGIAPNPSVAHSLTVVPIALLVVYGLLRLSTSLFNELRELVFAKATEGAARSIALEVFEQLYALSLRFHLERRTGGMTRDIERGTRAVRTLIAMSLYSVVPTLIELALVLAILAVKFGALFALIATASLVLHIIFTKVMTDWRAKFRREMNEIDSRTHSHAIDALLNYETVKYFNNEALEAQRYDKGLEQFRKAALKNQMTLSLLNAGQQMLIALGMSLILWRASAGVIAGQLTLGDLVMINAFMIQLFVPLNLLGAIYREIKQSLIDLDRMFVLMAHEREVKDAPDATTLKEGELCVRFNDVSFSYDAERPVLHHVSFDIPAGKTVAVVGASGSGKSTLARLLFRFYDVKAGSISIGNSDIRELTQSSLRRNIGIVPQDAVLFNDTVAYNIGYGRQEAVHEEIVAAAKAARIHDFIMATPKRYETLVGERGLKLSGGEKQRLAIARTLLKNPPLLIFDEATSALDSANERAIQSELLAALRNRTTLVIAHRLSTIVDAHEILVLDAGRIVERGTHDQLMARGATYAQMWALQKNGDRSSTSIGARP